MCTRKPKASGSTARSTAIGDDMRSTSEHHHISTSAIRADAGWTLIELMIVISIVMILAAMALTQYRNSILYAKEAALNSDLFLMRDAIDQYYADKGKYPETLQSLVTESYLRAIPRDPFTNSSDTWTTTAADPQPGQ